MTAVGIGVGAAYTSQLPHYQSGTSNRISAVRLPAISYLYDGQTVGDMAGWATLTSESNYKSSIGTVRAKDVTITFLGDAVDATTALAEGQTADFRITVTDDQGTGPVVFDVTGEPVQYKTRIQSTADNEAEIDINPLVPDGETVSLTITGGYAGTYSFTAGELRNDISNFAGTTGIEYAGDAADLDVGDVLTADEGLFTSPDGSDLSFSIQWTRNNAGIPGAVGNTYVLTEADKGKDLGFLLTPSNEATTGAPVSAAAVRIPAEDVLREEPAYLGGTISSTSADNTVLTLITSDLTSGDRVYVAVNAVHNTIDTTRISSLILAGNTVTPSAITLGNGRVQSATFSFDYDSAMGALVSIEVTTSGAQHVSAAAWKANGWTDVETVAVNTPAPVLSLISAVSKVAGGYVLALGSDSGRNAAPGLVGLVSQGPVLVAPSNAQIQSVPARLDVATTEVSALGLAHSPETNMGFALINLRG